MTEADEQEAAPGQRPAPEPGPWLPYLLVLALAGVIGLVLAVYVWVNREEIWRILSQSPT